MRLYLNLKCYHPISLFTSYTKRMIMIYRFIYNLVRVYDKIIRLDKMRVIYIVYTNSFIYVYIMYRYTYTLYNMYIKTLILNSR